MSAIVVDVETTDKDNPEVVECAWQTFGFPFGAAQRGQTQRFKPTHPSKWGAYATHHILPEELVACPPSSTAGNFVPPVSFWIGHNIDFDWRALGAPHGIRRVCTLAMSRFLWPDLDSHSLVAMTYFVGGANKMTRELALAAHGAAADVMMTELLLHRICHEAGLQDLESLYAFSEEARIPRFWTFGKFAGKPIAAADRGYANWYRKLDDADPYLLEALRRERLL